MISTVLMCQWSLMSCLPVILNLKELPDIPDQPDFRKTREKSSHSTKLPPFNIITDTGKSPSLRSTTQPPTNSSFRPIKLTHEDVMPNSVHSSSSSVSNHGIIFAIKHGQDTSSQSLMPACNLSHQLT